ncbi:class I SAM-dependent methyltransferase [Candidatus Falkowbacteria bacterium]|nr:class I SAM-dependent methyltransferase [Candidatus Falkowbacteria bacterium]
MFKFLFLKFLKNKKFKGLLHLSFAEKNYIFGEKISNEEEANLISSINIRVINKEFFKQVILFGDTGLGEAYFLKEFETDDIKKLLQWFIQNKEVLPGFRRRKFSHIFFEWAKFLLYLSHLKNKNTIEGSKKNIQAHYDISNNFYQLWLDKTMTYSSAVFNEAEDLETGQLNKYRKICESINLKKDDRLLEIGTGWGGFAMYAVKNFGCHVTTTTISQEQFSYAKNKITEEGLAASIDLQFKDYRDLEGIYDKIVSIEMMEAIGHKYVPAFIAKCNSLLAEGGKICLQFITYPDKDFTAYLKNTGFIKKYIFPGGELLSLGQVKKELTNNNLMVNLVESIGQDYAKTLNIWRNNFLAKKDEILALGFSEENFRMWLYYFVYCEVGFASAYIDDVQVAIHKNK